MNSVWIDFKALACFLLRRCEWERLTSSQQSRSVSITEICLVRCHPLVHRRLVFSKASMHTDLSRPDIDSLPSGYHTGTGMTQNAIHGLIPSGPRELKVCEQDKQTIWQEHGSSPNNHRLIRNASNPHLQVHHTYLSISKSSLAPWLGHAVAELVKRGSGPA